MLGRLRRQRRSAHQVVFRRIYAGHEWGSGESVSGPGSGVARTADLRRELAELLVELRIETMLDAGCGDFHWLRLPALPVRRYIGVEVVPELAADVARRFAQHGREFICADITWDRLPQADLVLCREVLVHFPDEDVVRALQNLRRTGARWLLTTTFADREQNEPIPLGAWRTLNLEAPPFDLPPPVRALPDLPLVDRENYLDKRLALWEFAALTMI
jgi:SAM-dependent methyltransferase